jgi:hypothetical protein
MTTQLTRFSRNLWLTALLVATLSDHLHALEKAVVAFDFVHAAVCCAAMLEELGEYPPSS